MDKAYEILFRGRKKRGTEWFKGDLSYLVHDKQKCYIFPSDGYNSPDYYEVDPDTIGQYTNKTDKNKGKIFLGDILELTDTDGYKSRYTVIWNDTQWCIKENDTQVIDDMRNWDPQEWKIIGNIYDNPELLKEESTV